MIWRWQQCSRQSPDKRGFPQRAVEDEIDLHPIAISDRAAIRELALDPEQEQFAGSVDAIFNDLQNSRYPDLEHPFAMVGRGKNVGFFILREKLAMPDWAPGDAMTLHSFRVSKDCQGKSYGRAGVHLAVSWVRRNRAEVRHVMLAVNARNGLARSLYLKAGFVDTGEVFHGPIGAQNILSLEMPRHDG